MSSPDTGVSGRAYDTAGRLITAVDARGTKVSYGYDLLDRQRTATYADASQNITFAYDDANVITGCSSSASIGRLTRLIEGAGGGTSYCYDKRGNVTRKVQIQSSGQVDTTQYVYTLGNRLAKIIYPSGHAVLYDRDANGRVTAVRWQATGASSASPLVSGITYLPFGPVKQYALGTAASQVVARAYDRDYQIAIVSSPALQLYLTRDATGNIDSASTWTHDLQTTTYFHDALHRFVGHKLMAGVLIGGEINRREETYAYNLTGDRLSKTSLGLSNAQATGKYLYEPGTHHLIAVGTAARRYDANGNTTSSASDGETFNFAYNGRNRLTLVQRNGKDVATYAYNALGERISKDTLYSRPLSQRFVYNEQHQLLGEYGDTSRDYVWTDDLPVAVVDTQGATVTIGYIHADGLNSPRAVTDASDELIWAWPYLGNPMGEQQSISSNGYTLNLRFPGQYYDTESGQHYNLQRDYEPATGRYRQPDPIGLKAGASLYAYVNNNPLNYIDPWGLCPPNTHPATLDEVNKILDAANDFLGKGLTYSDIKCNQLVDRAINNAFPGALPSEFNTSQMRAGQGPFQAVDSASVGNLALMSKPGHVVLVTSAYDGLVTEFIGSQTTKGPQAVKLPNPYWSGVLEKEGNVIYLEICLPD